MNGEGFMFSLDGGAAPVCRKTIYKDFHRALNNIGITEEEISERHLHLHGWRHFFNTELLKGGLSIPQVQAVTRHKSERMTDWYNHFDPTEFIKAKEVQEALLQPDHRKEQPGKTEQPANRAGRGTVIPFRDNETAKQRRA
jgi:integrase